MMNNNKTIDHQKMLTDILKDDKTVRYILFGIGAIAVLFVSGKIMKIVASTVYEFKNLKNVIKN
jgi:bacteriorhodopsin